MIDQTLKLLQNFPDKWILFILCIGVAFVYFESRDDFSRQLLNSVISALIGLLIGRSSSRMADNQPPQIKTDNIETVDNTGGVIAMTKTDKEVSENSN